MKEAGLNYVSYKHVDEGEGRVGVQGGRISVVQVLG